MIVCLDTSVLLQIFGRKQPFQPILRALLEGHLALAVTTEILFEYQEVTTRLSGAARWRDVAALLEVLGQLHGNIHHVTPQFRFHVIDADPDDNKFCDCAIALGADFIVTEDSHFDALNSAGYKPKSISPTEFITQFLAA